MSKMGPHDPFGTFNISYGQKKGQKSNYQLDSWPLKVRNGPNYLLFMWHATYFWKALNKGYNFVLNLISIRGLCAKLWAPKVVGAPTMGISGLPLGNPETKWHLGVGLVARHKVYHKGGRWWLPPSSSHGESCEFVFACGSSMHQSAPTTH
jgi:hypothetical protein